MEVPMYFSKYVHREPDEYEPWELDEQGEPRFTDEFHDAVHYATYEIEVVMQPSPQAGTCEIIAIRDGDKWFIPLEPERQRCVPTANFHTSPHRGCILR